MSADPQPSGQDKMTASDTTLAGVHGSCPEPMEVQTADKTNADTMSSTNDIQAPEAMEVDPTDTIESGERGEDTDRKVEEVGAATTANIGAVGDKESAGNEAAELRKTDDKSDMDGVSHKDNVQLHADRQKELDHNKNTDGVSEKGRVQKNADEPRTTIDKGMADADVNDNVQQIADESRETNDKEMKDPSDKDNKQENTDESREPDNKNKDGASDEDNVQQNTDESRESENKDKDGAADKDNIQQNTDESRESENKDKDVAADRDNIQQNTDESRKTADIDMDDVSDKDNVQQTADDSGEPVDKDKDGAGDTERRDADDSGKTNETPDNKTPGEGHTNKYDIPDTLEGFGYIFNDEGKLRHKETGQPFEFQVYPDHSANQKRYEAIGEVITEYVYELLETKAHLKRIWLPTDASEEEAKSFFFATDDALTNDKLLILIHGSGVVRAGQWARRLIINDNLACGTQLPFILRAVEEGYGVMVLNTNLNRVTLDGRYVYIRENSTPDRHGLYVWENFVEKAKAAHIAIVAHSYGGVVTTNLLKARTDDFQKRVFAVAFTDSVHSVPHQHICQRFYQKNARNWISSNYPLDKEVEDYGYDAPLVSAGHPKHEWTSWSSLKSIFKFFTEKYTERTGELRHEQEED